MSSIQGIFTLYLKRRPLVSNIRDTICLASMAVNDEIVSFFEHGRPSCKAYDAMAAHLAIGVARCAQENRLSWEYCQLLPALDIPHLSVPASSDYGLALSGKHCACSKATNKYPALFNRHLYANTHSAAI
jgi:hypothetical protein